MGVGSMKNGEMFDMLSWTHSFSIAAAIEVEPLFVEPFLIQVLYNPQCFLLYEDTALPPSQWKVLQTEHTPHPYMPHPYVPRPLCPALMCPTLMCPALCAPPFLSHLHCMYCLLTGAYIHLRPLLFVCR